MIIKLNTILEKCSNLKFRSNYIKYLKSLDFEEFQYLFVEYAFIINALIVRYDKYKFPNKYWFKKQILNYKFNLLTNIFFDANKNYLLTINDKIGEINKKREVILNEIMNNRKTLEILASKEIILDFPVTDKKLIEFNILIFDNIYLTKKIDQLINDLDKLKLYHNEKF